MNLDYGEPINIGSDELVTINKLADIIIKESGKKIKKKYDTSKPEGVRGRNSDNSLVKEVLGWMPEVNLLEGMRRTYAWIALQVEGRE